MDRKEWASVVRVARLPTERGCSPAEEEFIFHQKWLQIPVNPFRYLPSCCAMVTGHSNNLLYVLLVAVTVARGRNKSDKYAMSSIVIT